ATAWRFLPSPRREQFVPARQWPQRRLAESEWAAAPCRCQSRSWLVRSPLCLLKGGAPLDATPRLPSRGEPIPFLFVSTLRRRFSCLASWALRIWITYKLLGM